MNSKISGIFKNIADVIYKYFGESSGKMLLATSIIGIMASTLAQTGAIICNKKYTDSQKAFMIPQELTEGCVTILSIFFITKPIQKFASKCFKSGKILSTEMVDYMKKNQLIEKRGKADFDFSKSVKGIIQKIEESDAFIRATSLEKESMLSNHKKVLQDYDIMLDATSAIATTAAAMTSSAIVSPLLRNHVASRFQAASLKYMHSNDDKEQVINNSVANNINKNVNYKISPSGLKI